MGGSRQLSANPTLDGSVPPRSPILCLAPLRRGFAEIPDFETPLDGALSRRIGHGRSVSGSGLGANLTTSYQNNAGAAPCPAAGFTCSARFDDVLTVGPRIGFAAGKWMPYITGGYASARFTEQANNKSLLPVATTIVSWAQDRAQGWYLGGGVEWALSHGWVVGLEYRHYDFDSHTGLANAVVGGVSGVGIPNDNAVFSHHADTIALRVSWKLGRPEPAPLK